MANDTITNVNDSSYDSMLENAQRTVFLKELFSQVNHGFALCIENIMFFFLFSFAEKLRTLRI